MKEIAWWVLAIMGSAAFANCVELYAAIIVRI